MYLNKVTVDAKTNAIPNFLKNLVIKHIFTEPANQCYTVGEALCLCTLDYLHKEGFRDKELGIIVNNYAKNIIQFGDDVLAKTLTTTADKHPMCKLGIMDNRCCILDGCSSFVDIATDVSIEMAKWPIKTVIYDLTGVFFDYIKPELKNV